MKTSKNADPELVRFARWWEQNEAKKRGGYTHEEPEEMSRKLMPASAGSSPTSWESVSVWETQWPAKATVAEGEKTQMPMTPGNTKRRTKEHNPAIMEDEIDETTAEEIKQLELRLALLKDKARARSANQ